MRFSEMFSGMFVVRTRELLTAPQLSGEIIYIRDQSTPGKLVAELTRECAPVGNPFTIDSTGDDGNWYDVTSLVLEANHKIAPSMSEVTYEDDVAVSYRNELDIVDSLTPLEPEDAEDCVCLIGALTDGRTLLSRGGYYVLASDKNGYMIAYQGYCGVAGKPSNEAPKLVIINLTGLPRKMYNARPVVAACNAAYLEDTSRADTFSRQIQERTVASAGESSLSRGNYLDVREMVLEGAFC